MIRNQWYVVLRSNEAKPDKPIGVTRMGEKLVFWRDKAGGVICQADLCPHRGAALSLGKTHAGVIQCPFHGFEFDPEGKCTRVPANGLASKPPQALRVGTYPAREAHGYIYIWWGVPQAEYPPLPWFDDLDETYTTADFHDHWSVDYSRAIENQLDAFHLPFVHDTTIGRGGRTIADGPVYKMVGNEMQIWVHNRLDDGTSVARRASELPQPQGTPSLRFQFPNLWMNLISDDIRITAFFAPVDDENCVIYLRSYQRFMRVPILKNVVTWFFNPSNRVILNQDKRVVLTQRPKKSGLKIAETLIPADGPIIAYRSRRRDLQKSAGQIVD